MIESPPMPRPGELTIGWRWTVALAWIGVIIGFSMISRSSRELGLPVWWLGPPNDPQPYPILALPFIVPAVVVALAFTRFRWTPWMALGAGTGMMLIGFGDVIGDYPRFGAVEMALGAAGAAVGAASLTGRVSQSNG